ncbi:hypothetical protein IQ244_22470 [Nostoc sp. LEGE 06077]|uniref:hypothetical protein n=1 Tax=Nostoc sp. LEGE 06077 TaxID=915325 RepID=UPI00187F7975|nr:hypothetical protein [Nostoc sp. LEGE 06077]MBE9209220.1 hypothetical protein [Nostoc sp. LEGE 06077]
MSISIWKRTTDFFNKNWPILASGGAGIIVGMFILGQLVSGIKVSTKDGFEVVIDRTTLPTELDIDGDWYYKAETNEAETRFTEDKCRIRVGTVGIKHKFGTSEVILSGHRIVRTECGKDKPTIVGTAIRWKGNDAAVKQKEGELFFWLDTDDNEPRYGYVSTTIKTEDGKKPSKMNGTMFYLSYLENGKKTWFKAKIDFYRIDTPQAIQLKTIYPDLQKY